MSETTERHVHDWTRDDDRHVCTECDATSATCNVCERATGSALLVCQRCLDYEAQVLADIEHALRHYQPPARSVVPAIRYDRDRRGDNRDRVPIDLSGGPEEVEAVLWDWVAAWTDASGDAQNLGAADYLRGHLLWAGHNVEASGWDAYRGEMRQLRHRARGLAGLLPKRQAGRCIYCEGEVVRDWADEEWRPRRDGLSDELRCRDCRVSWADEQRWRLANLHTIRALPYSHPDALVTTATARSIYPDVPPATWRSWVRRDAERGERAARWAAMLEEGYYGPAPEPERMPVRGHDVRGVALYLLADLTAHVAHRADDTRPGRKAC